LCFHLPESDLKLQCLFSTGGKALLGANVSSANSTHRYVKN
jgi:hypothetical protein